MLLDKIAELNDIEFSDKPCSSALIKKISKVVNCSVGEQLVEYLSRFGFCSFEYVELYGANERQKLNSDMVLKTLELHEYHPNTQAYLLLEDQGDGDYLLIDGKDKIYSYIPTLNKEIIDMRQDLRTYILERYQVAHQSL